MRDHAAEKEENEQTHEAEEAENAAHQIRRRDARVRWLSGSARWVCASYCSSVTHSLLIVTVAIATVAT